MAPVLQKYHQLTLIVVKYPSAIRKRCYKGALASVLMVYPFTSLLPEMLQGFLFPQGAISSTLCQGHRGICFIDILGVTWDHMGEQWENTGSL
jgi:hypothetical protein